MATRKKSVFQVRGNERGKIVALLKWANIVAVQDAKNAIKNDERVDADYFRFVDEAKVKRALETIMDRCKACLAKTF